LFVALETPTAIAKRLAYKIKTDIKKAYFEIIVRNILFGLIVVSLLVIRGCKTG